VQRIAREQCDITGPHILWSRTGRRLEAEMETATAAGLNKKEIFYFESVGGVLIQIFYASYTLYTPF
jgi:hypothetical protein